MDVIKSHCVNLDKKALLLCCAGLCVCFLFVFNPISGL